MRIIGTIPHPSIRITVMSMNEKFILRLEAGPMEQLYKLEPSQIPGLEAIEKLLDGEFLTKIIKNFNEMYLALNEAKKRLSVES